MMKMNKSKLVLINLQCSFSIKVQMIKKFPSMLELVPKNKVQIKTDHKKTKKSSALRLAK